MNHNENKLIEIIEDLCETINDLNQSGRRDFKSALEAWEKAFIHVESAKYVVETLKKGKGYLGIPKEYKIYTMEKNYEEQKEERIYFDNKGFFSLDNTVHFTKDQAESLTKFLNTNIKTRRFFIEKEGNLNGF